MSISSKPPLVIGIAGGSSSGKSAVCHTIMEHLNTLLGENASSHVAVIRMDSFYKVLTAEELSKAKEGKYNFDHPDAFDFDLLSDTLSKLIMGQSVSIPEYDALRFERSNSAQTVEPADIIIFEGVFALYDKTIRNKLNIKIFVDEDSDTRLVRRIQRDTEDLKRSVEWTLEQYETFVKPSFEEFIQPTKRLADLIVPQSFPKQNSIAIGVIVKYIEDKLTQAVMLDVGTQPVIPGTPLSERAAALRARALRATPGRGKSTPVVAYESS